MLIIYLIVLVQVMVGAHAGCAQIFDPVTQNNTIDVSFGIYVLGGSSKWISNTRYVK